MKVQDRKLDQYNVLVESIDFFTQRFHVEQIIKHAYKTVKRLLNIKASALFIRSGNEFILHDQTSYNINDYHIRSNNKLDQLPLFHSGVLTSNLKTYFTSEFIELFQIKMAIPLINDTELYGFIVTNGSQDNEIIEIDQSLIENMLKLINYSIENNQRFLDFQKINSDLDSKIFNLFVINQSTKALLSDINFDHLFSLATDVFSEVTGSKITTFGIYDSLTEKIKITGYRNVNSFSGYYTELELTTTQYDSSNIVLHMKDDIDTIKGLFKNWEELNRLEAEYIVLIVKGEILGIVTISESVMGDAYSHTEFELIESLASTTYIAISNAKLFREVTLQKEQTEKKYKALSTLNRLVRTINSCKTKEEIYSLILQTLQLGYGVKQAFICINKDLNQYEIIDAMNEDLVGEQFTIPNELLLEGKEETYYDYRSNHVYDYFTDTSFLDSLGEITCLVLSPIKTQGEFENNDNPFGFLVVVNTKENLKEEEIMVIDTITKNVSPIIYQMDLAHQYKKQISINEKQEFITALQKSIEENEFMNTEFYVYMKQIHKSPFEAVSLDNLFQEMDFEEHVSDQVFTVNNYAFVITSHLKETKTWQKVISPQAVEDVLTNPFE